MRVEIYKLEDNGTQDKVLTYSLDNGVISYSGDETLNQMLEAEGIKNYSDVEQRLFPKDGLIFLENLKHHFRTGYYNATDLIE